MIQRNRRKADLDNVCFFVLLSEMGMYVDASTPLCDTVPRTSWERTPV